MSLQRFLSLINNEGELVPCINDRKLQVKKHVMIFKKVRVLCLEPQQIKKASCRCHFLSQKFQRISTVVLELERAG